MIVSRCAVAGLIALASSASRIVSAQPFSTLAAKEQQQHGEFGNVAESSNTAGADDGRPGTFQFLGGGDGGDEEEGESTTSARSRSEGVAQEMQVAAAKDDEAAKSHKGGVDDVEADGADASVPTAAPTLANPSIA